MDEKKFLKGLISALGLEDNDVVYIDGWALKIDGSAASTSKLPFQTWRDFGWRNVAAAYSDIRVKYVEPLYMLVSVTAPRLEEAAEIIEGAREAATRLSLRYVGGDLNQGGDVVVDVAIIGRATYRIGRTPKPGDILVTIPKFGYTSLAYRYWRDDDPVVAKGVEMLKRPEPLWPLPPPECVTASMDSSDGLADVLWTMANGVDIIVESLPVPEEVLSFAKERGLDIGELVFNGGEEFLPVFAIRRDCDVKEPYVTFAKVAEGRGVVWWDGRELKWRGWAYFRTS
ncbi:thiamine monophosphate kinase-like protein [Pyrobaculum islandicum DSM 4184]|uniref:Thiamine monophosphate kinase-like protein n=1 Tax=Pyrobaculum islandicum (strain DSM 4184 / JCM 9189 / GEO3) TaxID=384616 RepID=A1RTT7_PYRIL|nr:AIR synthase related protein [Pyrobaculum islandicum]ABL88369.1 thiamine monophosphate kinase-like protein [Pyrobaculum islandicum DSM 4184]